MNIFDIYLDKIIRIVTNQNKKDLLKLPKKLDSINVDIPPKQFDCDISTNVSMVLAKINETQPIELANKLALLIKKVDSNIEADIWFTPNMVIEIIASEITLSPIHTCSINNIRKGSGLALRFPKFKGQIRKDKSPIDATNSKEVEQMYLRQLKKIEKIT